MPRKSVKLVSAEGFEFTVDYKAACVSNTIKQMLSSEGAFSGTCLRQTVRSNITLQQFMHGHHS